MTGFCPKLPKVLVIIGNYKQSEFIEGAALSVKAQIYKNFRCVIVDDCSEDGSDQVIQGLLQRLSDNRFSAHLAQENGGQMSTMLHGLNADEEHECDFVAFLDADDAWDPEFLSTHLSAHLLEHGRVGITSSPMRLINKSDTVLSGSNTRSISKPDRFISQKNRLKPIDPHLPEDFRSLLTRPQKAHYLHTLAAWIWSATSGIVFRRSVLEQVRPQNPENIRICADTYWCELVNFLSGTIIIDQCLGYYRVHGNNNFAGASADAAKVQKLTENRRKMNAEMLMMLESGSAEAGSFRRNFEEFFFRQKCRWEAGQISRLRWSAEKKKYALFCRFHKRFGL